MRVRMKHQISGTRCGQDWPAPGGEIDLPDDEAVTVLKSGMAEPMADAGEPETAIPPDASEKRPTRSRKGATIKE